MLHTAMKACRKRKKRQRGTLCTLQNSSSSQHASYRDGRPGGEIEGKIIGEKRVREIEEKKGGRKG
jgi:hypothetical protein